MNGYASMPERLADLGSSILKTVRVTRGWLAQWGMIACLLAAWGCPSPGPFIWVDDYLERSAPERHGYIITPGDTIQVRVFNQDQLTTKTKVRADGKVSLPLLNDVMAAGLTPVAFAQQLQERLKDFIKAPLVVVSLEEAHAQTIYVAGQVAKPGAYPLESNAGVLQALVSAGGLGPDADKDRIFVLRQAPQPVRIRFTYEQLTRLSGKAPKFHLEPGDVVVAE
jgi:polysaccharide biosynthesis/export protein